MKNPHQTSGSLILLGTLLLFGATSPLLAQTEEEPMHGLEGVAVAGPGSTLSIPLAEEKDSDPRHYETPELAGTHLATGSQLIDGRLPQPLADYVTRAGSILQRLSLFENGLVVAHLEGVGGTIYKRLIIPKDGIAAIRENLEPAALASISELFGPDSGATSYVLLRVYDDSGEPVERRFHTAAILPGNLERPRAILQDLLRAIAEDREVTNSIARYMPVVGDRLVGEDQKLYEVLSVVRGGEYVEMRSVADPITLFVATKDMHKFFVGKPATSRP